MQYRVLGPVAVVDADGAHVDLGGPKPRALIARLLLAGGNAVSVDALVEELWRDSPPRSAVGTVHAYVARLRRVLPDGVLVTSKSGYALRVERDELDSDRFAATLEAAQTARTRGDFPGAIALMREALRLWRGDPFGELPDSDLARGEAARLQELRRTAEEACWEIALDTDARDQLVAELETGVAAEPLRERRWALLMTALYQEGRQVDALRRYQDLRQMLAEELGVEPSPELVGLERAILVHDPALDRAPADRESTPARPLPVPVTSFVGRAADRRAIADAIAANRLITLIGPGGVGKTRLALEAAHDRRSATRNDLAVFVDLSGVTDASAIADAIADAIVTDRRPSQDAMAAIAARLGVRDALVVLDNCEHLLGECAAVGLELLQAVPGLRIVATSREPLGVPGEVVWRLEPLVLDDAVALFHARAPQQADAAAADVAALCEHLDRLPLALELAAAGAGAVGVQQLIEGLARGFAILGEPHRVGPRRQRTLDDVIAWSHDLLGDDDRVLFAALSVFPGSFDAAAVEAVSAGVTGQPEFDAVGRLAKLVNKSLVELEPGNRYRLLVTIREFARGQLDAAGLSGRARDAHLAHFTALAADAGANLRGSAQADWLRRCDIERANLRAAVEWAVATAQASVAISMGVNLFRFWLVRGHAAEGRALLEQALMAEPTHDAAGWAQLRAAGLAESQGDVAAARAHQRAALQAACAAGDAELEALVRNEMGTTERDAGDLDLGVEHGVAAVAVARTVSEAVLATALGNLGGTYLAAGRYEDARVLLAEAWPRLESVGDVHALSVALGNMAVAAFVGGDTATAKSFAQRARDMHEQLGDRNGVAINLALLAQVEQAHGDLPAADAAASEALAILREVGAPVNVSIMLGTVAAIRIDRGLDPGPLLDEKLTRDRSAGFLAGEATALLLRARYEASVGATARAAATLEEARTRAQDSGNDAVAAEVNAAAAAWPHAVTPSADADGVTPGDHVATSS